jgi:hypothetical protein
MDDGRSLSHASAVALYICAVLDRAGMYSSMYDVSSVYHYEYMRERSYPEQSRSREAEEQRSARHDLISFDKQAHIVAIIPLHSPPNNVEYTSIRHHSSILSATPRHAAATLAFALALALAVSECVKGRVCQVDGCK